MRLLLISVVLTVGCTHESRSPVPQRFDDAFRIEETFANARLNAIRMDRFGLVAKAVEQMRQATIKRFGPKAATEATIAADLHDVNEVAPDKWEVVGSYDGSDRSGKRFIAPFVVSMEIVVGHLMASRVKLKERTYSPRSG